MSKSLEELKAEFLEHSGVKGMKWGQRKEDEVVLHKELASGGSVTITKDPPGAIVRGLSKLSPSYKAATSKTSFFTLRDDQGKKVGDAQIYRKSPEELNLVWLGVKGNQRGKGYATAAMKGVVKHAQREGIKKLTLEVPGASPDALHIYEKLGFKTGKKISGDGDIWGGLTEMEMDLDRVSHSDLDEDLLAEELSHIFASMILEMESLEHSGVKGMKWGKHGMAADYSDQRAKRDTQVYGKRGAKRINKSLHEGNQISTARGDEKTRRDNVMAKNKYVRQVGKLGGGALGAGLGFAAIRGIGNLSTSAAGQKVAKKILGQHADAAIFALNSPIAAGAVTLGAAKVGHMLSGDIAVNANMRAHGYNPNRK